METRPTRSTRPVRQEVPSVIEEKQPENPSPADKAEQVLIAYVSSEIEKMQQASKIGHGREATFSEINEALMNYSSTQIALLSAHNIARINFIREKEEYDEWFANRYLTIRKEVNPVTLSAQKWFSQKEIEMMVKNKYKEEYKSRIWDLHQTEHKLNFLRRLIDSWEKHSFILHQLGKNLQSEINANLRQTGGSDMSFGDDGGFPA